MGSNICRQTGLHYCEALSVPCLVSCHLQAADPLIFKYLKIAHLQQTVWLEQLAVTLVTSFVLYFWRYLQILALCYCYYYYTFLKLYCTAAPLFLSGQREIHTISSRQTTFIKVSKLGTGDI